VALQGPDEIAQGVVKLKRLADGSEVNVPRADAAARVRALV
jgi:histidyl-tRNA synthetase